MVKVTRALYLKLDISEIQSRLITCEREPTFHQAFPCQKVPPFGRTVLLHRRRTLEERRKMSRPIKPEVISANTVGPPEDTGTSGMAPSIEVGMRTSNLIPTVFRWWTNPTLPMEEKPKNVRIVSFSTRRGAGYLKQCLMPFRFVSVALLTLGYLFR